MSDISLIADLQEELAAVRAAKTAALTNGNKHALNGSHSHESVPYKELVRREGQIIAQLIQLNGGNSLVLPDYSGGTADNVAALRNR